MLNLGRLQVLCEVVEHGSFSAAAESLSYTQSAVSQAIARLEAETGAPLLLRGRRGVTPTAAGAALVAHAELIFEQVRAAEADIAAVMGVRTGRLRVGSFSSGGATLMPPAVARFRRAHPDVVLTLEDGEPEETGPAIARGRARPGAALRVSRRPSPPPPARRRAALGQAAGGPDARGAARRASPGGHAGRCGSPISATSRGSRPRLAARAHGTCCPPAWRPASSRPWPSSPTTSTPFRGSSPPASAWR